MAKKIFRFLFTIIGVVFGCELTYYLVNNQELIKLFRLELVGLNYIIAIILGGLISGIIVFLLSPSVINFIDKITKQAEKSLQATSFDEKIVGLLGLILGLSLAYLICSGPIKLIPNAGVAITLSFLIYALMAYLGVNLAVKEKDNLTNILFLTKRTLHKEKDKTVKNEINTVPKILDTSVIIDGRIADICKTGFVEGPLIIPTFVLEELRHIADSQDSLKRNRGRRGLDILNKIQNELSIQVQIVEKDFEDVSEVDVKLIKLAQYMNGCIITNDYNLNKVAEFQRVPVLNINELANAVKPVVLPGEEMVVQVIKDGKESGQGIGYLDDGTMIVIESGKKCIGETINVVVTSVLQTAAGRMIFVKPKSAIDKVS